MIIRNIGRFVKHIEGVMLLPGTNEVTDKQFKKISAHPLFEKIDDLVVEKKKEITKLTVKEAKELIEDTFNPELLRSWKEKDSRTGVIKSIDKQLEELLNPPEDKKKETEEDSKDENGYEWV